jgi:hypothetical protein
MQCYTSGLSLTRRVYPIGASKGAVTGLSSRTFGTWTLLTGVVRLFAAYHLEDPSWYNLAIATYFVAFWHFGSELLFYRTTRLISGATPTYLVSIGTLIWMVKERDGYVFA